MKLVATLILVKSCQRAISGCDVATLQRGGVACLRSFWRSLRVTELDVNPGESSSHGVDNLITGHNIMKHDRMDHLQQYNISKYIYLSIICLNSSHMFTPNHKHVDFSPRIAVGNVLTLLTPVTSGLQF